MLGGSVGVGETTGVVGVGATLVGVGLGVTASVATGSAAVGLLEVVGDALRPEENLSDGATPVGSTRGLRLY